ncbi:major facilitator superfamily domain-containing protein [Lentinula raphanica]|uniref:Major facilitator superfamily domain-containing protein n=1 Tax=Lentinula raphanica TaxID=153919 RepID=A0AA38NYX7_9AGAR|nr:major facilitator superfamily domain-containing protein [Lentinula raphanica]KAJ3833213.1 major facilitator superfamily domain-containing protein [Lentinula raphanica]KAJ3971672.1 major facilitator superfamily domain-containing protein [Lentinula raphanica]
MAGHQPSAHAESTSVSERSPLIGTSASQPATQRKPFYRARPLWLVPFAITASLVRGMTMAPRVEVFTQLACASMHHHIRHTYNSNNSTSNFQSHNLEPHVLSLYSTLDPLGPHLPEHLSIPTQTDTTRIGHLSPEVSQDQPDSDPGSTSEDNPDNDEDPRKLPSPQCVQDPRVQKEAARIQTILTTTMGLLSAFSTGWWGHFSERHGRTRVLAMATLGLFLTDLTFILVATPGSPLSAHGHKLLVIAPIIEGLLGGWSTLQSATSAYVSDCTSPGSRATIFSRFNGVFFLGFSIGPVVGGWIIRNGIPGIDRIGTITKQGKSVTEVFWLAICLSFLNFLLTTFLFPESLSKEQQEKAKLAHDGDNSTGRADSGQDTSHTTGNGNALTSGKDSIMQRVFSPLALFLPVVITETTQAGIRKRKDWSLTFLAIAMFLYMLSTGVYQIKYLYVVHTYNWAADQLSYYISYLGGLRALGLLFILPSVISTFKPKHPPGQGKQSKPTKGRLAVEINFDLFLSRCSLFIDILSQLLVTIIPAPETVHHMREVTADSLSAPVWIHDSNTRNTVLFILVSGMSSIGSGFIPACQSLALCIVQARQLVEGRFDTDRTEEEEESEFGAGGLKPQTDTGIGKLFGALSMLQAVGQMILGPLLFGLLYGNTVAFFPKAIFVCGCAILTTALACAFLIRSPVERESGGQKAKGKKKVAERERGRSRVSKDLFGGTSGSSSSISGSSDGTTSILEA